MLMLLLQSIWTWEDILEEDLKIITKPLYPAGVVAIVSIAPTFIQSKISNSLSIAIGPQLKPSFCQWLFALATVQILFLFWKVICSCITLCSWKWPYSSLLSVNTHVGSSSSDLKPNDFTVLITWFCQLVSTQFNPSKRLWLLHVHHSTVLQNDCYLGQETQSECNQWDMWALPWFLQLDRDNAP